MTLRTFNLAPKIHQKSTQEAPKINEKGIEDKMQVDFGFGGLLERFLMDFRAKLGAKLDQVGTKIPENQHEKDIKNVSEFILIYLTY